MPIYTGFYVNIKVNLQGAYNPLTGGMTIAALNNLGYIPLSQPYSGTPWNYTGTESVVSIPNVNIVDWILIELRTSLGYNQTTFQELSIVGVADISNSLNGKYWLLPSTTTTYCLWYSTGTGIDPAIPGTTSKKVTITTGASSTSVINATVAIINAIQENSINVFSSGRSGTTLSVANLVSGNYFSSANVGTSGFTSLTILTPIIFRTFTQNAVSKRAAFILTNGRIVDLDGVSNLNFPDIASVGTYYVTVRHRNHLTITSSVLINGNALLYDFSIAQLQAYGTNPMFAESDSTFSTYGGDCNGNNIIEGQLSLPYNADKLIQNTQNGFNGYLSSDINLEGSSAASDSAIIIGNTKITAQISD